MLKDDLVATQMQHVANQCDGLQPVAGGAAAVLRDIDVSVALPYVAMVGWWLVALAVWMVYTGRLVPKRFYDQVLRDGAPKLRDGRRKSKR